MEVALDFFGARGLATDEPSKGRFLEVDAAVDWEMDWDVIRDEVVGVARGSGRLAWYRKSFGEAAWFAIGSIPVQLLVSVIAGHKTNPQDTYRSRPIWAYSPHRISHCRVV